MMKRLVYLGVVLASINFIFFKINNTNAQAVGSSCFCISSTGVATCIPAADRAACESNYSCSKATWENTPKDCDNAVRNFNNPAPSPTVPSAGQTQPAPGLQAQSTLSKLITECGQKDMPPQCYDVKVFISLALQIVEFMFGIIGSIALLFFVYGGFVFILSQGNPEQITHGKAIIVSAVLGIVIAFSGYAIVKFVGTVVGVKSNYTLF